MYKGYIAGMKVTRIAQRILGGELDGNKTPRGTKLNKKKVLQCI